MKYDDLLNVPYLEGGRDINGMDCYGVLLECCRRNKTPLLDINDKHIPEDQLLQVIEKLNVRLIQENEVKEGDILQCVYNGNLHVGFMVDKDTVIHATNKGVRLTPIIAFSEKRFGRVQNG